MGFNSAFKRVKSEWDFTSTFPYAVFEETLVEMRAVSCRVEGDSFAHGMWQGVYKKSSGYCTKRRIHTNFSGM